MQTQHHKNILLTTLLMLVSACSAPISPPTTSKINVCYSSLVAAQTPIFYAYDMGIFKKYNLEPELIFTNGAPQATTALIAGQADLCLIGGSNVIGAIVAGADLVIIGSTINKQTYSLVVRPEIKSANDLKGKSVAISQPGSSIDVSMRAILTQLGLKPDIDVTLLSIGVERDRGLALDSGAVVATLVNPPATVEALERGHHILFNISELNLPSALNSIAATPKFVKENRTATINFMKAISEGIAGIKKDKTGAIAVMAKYLKLDPQKNAKSLEEAYNEMILKFTDKIPYPTVEGVRIELAAAQKTNPQTSTLKVENLIDTSIIQELEKAGFYTSLYQ